MADMVTGERVGGFVVMTDENGLRYAVCCHVVLALSTQTGPDDTTDPVMR